MRVGVGAEHVVVLFGRDRETKLSFAHEALFKGTLIEWVGQDTGGWSTHWQVPIHYCYHSSSSNAPPRPCTEATLTERLPRAGVVERPGRESPGHGGRGLSVSMIAQSGMVHACVP